MKVIDFRFASNDDVYNTKYVLPEMWSRPYEYEYVTNFIKINKHNDLSIPHIHNTSWGFEGVHVTFRDELDVIGNCIHSDIVKSTFRDTVYYDITTENVEFKDKFDFVVNISTIEHLNTVEQRLTTIRNLMKQLKKGGYLILTFDYPRVNLNEIETLINQKCYIPNNILNGSNSISPNTRYKDLNIINLILKNE